MKWTRLYFTFLLAAINFMAVLWVLLHLILIYLSPNGWMMIIEQNRTILTGEIVAMTFFAVASAIYGLNWLRQQKRTDKRCII